MRYMILSLVMISIAAFTCCCTEETPKPKGPAPSATGEKAAGPAKPETPATPPPAPAKKWVLRGDDGKYKVEYVESDHPLKARSRGQLSTLRTYTAVPAPAKGKKLVAVFDTSKGKISVELFHKEAPQHAANFVKLAQDDFYDGGYSHRIMKGFMIQGGDPNTKNADPNDDGSGGPGYCILDEFSRTRKHVPGILSAASTGQPHSSGCQFFLMHAANAGLDGRYSIYGQVIDGMDIVNKIADTPCVARSPRNPEPSLPQEKVYFTDITIEER
ncbi:MAG: peptidylprolyl isomerase [Planctomycetota bacterium]|nr:MAG: peptidylprolyl isomerase [Planctomycetota bacterium]